MESMGVLAFVGFILLAIAQLYLGFLGIDYLAGAAWAWAAIAAAFVLRFTLPLTIGAYFGAVEVMQWPWYLGVALAVPGLIFMIPAAVTAILESRNR